MVYPRQGCLTTGCNHKKMSVKVLSNSDPVKVEQLRWLLNVYLQSYRRYSSYPKGFFSSFQELCSRAWGSNTTPSQPLSTEHQRVQKVKENKDKPVMHVQPAERAHPLPPLQSNHKWLAKQKKATKVVQHAPIFRCYMALMKEPIGKNQTQVPHYKPLLF